MRMKNGIYHDQGTDTLFGMLYAYFRKITLKCRKGCEALIVVLSSSCPILSPWIFRDGKHGNNFNFRRHRFPLKTLTGGLPSVFKKKFIIYKLRIGLFKFFHLDRQLRRKLSYRLRVFVKVGLPNFRKSPRSYIWILWNIGQMKFSLKFVNNHSAADVNAFVKLEMDRLTNDY